MNSNKLQIADIAREPPTELRGWTWCIEFEKQKLFVTINHDGFRLREFFATELLDEEFVARLSRNLESGSCTIDYLVDELEQLAGTHSAVFMNGVIVNSPEHAVAECLKLASEYLENFK